MSATLFDFFGVEADIGKARTSDLPEPVRYRPLKASAAPKLSGETWEPYRLSSIAIEGGRTHGTPLVESSILASVRMPVPSYRPLLPPSIITKGLLSAEQLENVIFAGEQHKHTFPLTSVVYNEKGEPVEETDQETRYGFFIGDGTGVGKGRQVAAICLDNFNQGRTRAVWFSQSQILMNDAIRDWTELGGLKSDIVPWNKWGLRDDMDFRKGILFGTYALLRQRKYDLKTVVDETTGKEKVEKIPVTRLDQLVAALGPTFDGVIVFDECHNAGNADPAAGENVQASLQGMAVLELQERLPFARIVYVSATGAARVDALSYAPRLGLWKADGAFKNRDAFVAEMIAAGTSALEMISRDLKALGRMSSRSLSYEGITYQRLEYELDPGDIELYNGYSKMWRDIDHGFKEELVRLGGAYRGSDGKVATYSNREIAAGSSALQSRRQSFYQHVLLQLKMGTILTFAKQRLDAGRSVIMQLTHTNEAAATRAIEKMDESTSIDDVDLTQRDLMIDYVRKYYPIHRFRIVETTKEGLIKVDYMLDHNDEPIVDSAAVERRDEMLDMLETLLVVRDGPLEMIYDFFGEELVAEVTGRSRKIVRRTDPYTGETHREIISRGAKENERETEAFINGSKRVLVFSEQAGGTGRSYHADIRFKNHQPRTHILLEMSWRAESAVQSLGRSHRSNQVCPPEIIFPTTNVPGEKRFASTPARRIAALGALSRGDRTAASNGVFRPEDNLETPYALKALQSLLEDINKGVVEGLEPKTLTDQLGLPCDYKIIDAHTKELSVLISRSSVTIPKFLNRLLGTEVGPGAVQERIMEEFMARIDTEVQNAIDAGEYDLGVQQLRARSIVVKDREVIAEDKLTKAKTELLTIEAQRIPNTLSYESAIAKLAYYREHHHAPSPDLGFFSTGTRIELRIPSIVAFDLKGQPYIRVYGQLETDHGTVPSEDLKPAALVSDEDARALWNEAIAVIPGVKRNINAVVGAITPIWQHLPWSNPEIYQIRADDGERIIARVLTEAEVERTLRALGHLPALPVIAAA